MTQWAAELLMLIGQPGSGKSTLANALLAVPHEGFGLAEEQVGAAFVTHWRLPGGEVLELGRPDNGTGFRGSDRLTMNAIQHLKPWLEKYRHRFMFVEGDRFANNGFIDWAEQCGWRPFVFYLDLPDDVAAARRAARFEEKGEQWKFKTRKTTGPPNENWMKGRITKMKRLAARPGVIRLDAQQPVSALVGAVKEQLALQHSLWPLPSVEL